MEVAQRVVLLVNGHRDSRAIYRLILEYRGYTVVEAEDGVGGLRMAELVKPDVVVAEVIYPDDPNLDFVRALRGIDRLRGVKVVALTTSSVADTAGNALEAGCSHCFEQPFEPRRLLEVVEELVGGVHPTG